MPWQPDQRPTSSAGGLADVPPDRCARDAPDGRGLRLGNSIRIVADVGDRQLPAWTWRNWAKVAERRGDKAAAEELLQRFQGRGSRANATRYESPI